MAELDLIVPSQIPWERLKAKELEELLYWLLDSMGGKDLEWRVGGTGGGASDKGRDLECSFYTSGPDGDVVRQRWWIEAKGRAKTVEPTAVKEAVLNASGQADVDVLLIATNANFSNATRDWVKDHQRNHVRPVIKLWERTELERLCCKFPVGAGRLFQKALSPQGKLEAARSKFWNYSSLSDRATLSSLWKDKGELEISQEALLALIVSEFSNGDIGRRPWGMNVEPNLLLATLLTFLMNFFMLVFRSDERGHRQEPYIQAAGYLILCCVDRIGSEKIGPLLADWSQFDDRNWPDKIRNFILEPVLGSLIAELTDVCTNDCSRVMRSEKKLSDGEVDRYWRRLILASEDEAEEDPERILTIEAHETPCKVGFCVSKESGCPLNANDEPEIRIEETLREIERVVKFRKAEAMAEDRHLTP